MKAFLKSFVYALKGIVVSWSEQRNLKVQSALAVLAVAAGFYFDITASEWGLVLFAIGLVLSLEVVNTAIENLVDLISRERSALAGKVKDAAAGAVLLASVISLIIGILVFKRYIL